MNRTPRTMCFQFLLSFLPWLTIKISYSVERVIGYLLFIVWIKAIKPYSYGNRNSKRKQNVEIKKIKRKRKKNEDEEEGEEVPVRLDNEVVRCREMWTLDPWDEETRRKKEGESNVRSARMVRVSYVSESRDEEGLMWKKTEKTPGSIRGMTDIFVFLKNGF